MRQTGQIRGLGGIGRAPHRVLHRVRPLLVHDAHADDERRENPHLVDHHGLEGPQEGAENTQAKRLDRQGRGGGTRLTGALQLGDATACWCRRRTAYNL